MRPSTHCTGLLRPAPLKVFRDAYPGIALKPQLIGEWHIAIQKLAVALASGPVPDIALVKRSWIPRLAEAGRIAPLDQVLPAELVNDLQLTVRRGLTFQGHLFALPADGFCSVLFYNEHLVDPPPRTWEQLRQAAQKIGEPSADETEPVFPLGYVPFIETLWSAGGEVIDNGAGGLASPQAHEAMDFLLSLRDDGLVCPHGLENSDYAFQLFLAGRVAMTVASSMRLSDIGRAAFPVAVAPVPGRDEPVSMLSDNALVVFGDYATAKAAPIAAVMDFLTGPSMQGSEAVSKGSCPVRVSVTREVAVPDGLADAFRQARPAPLSGASDAIQSEIDLYLGLAYRWRGR